MSTITKSESNNESENQNESKNINSANNPFSLFLNVWTSPRSAFAELQAKPRIWYPLLAVLLLQVIVVVMYSYSVDFEWMLEQTITVSGQDLTAEQQQTISQMQGGMGPMMSAIFGSLAILVMFPILFALSALYYWLISLFTSDGNNFKKWFGLVCWSATPMLFTGLASLISILLNDNGQILQYDLNPLSLNSLIFKYNLGDPGFTFLSSVDMAMVWTVILNIIGYKAWTHKSTAVSSAIVCAPVVVILGVVGFFSFT